MHHQKDARYDLNHQYQQGKGTKKVPKIKVFRCVLFRQMLFIELGRWKTIVYPGHELFTNRRVGCSVFELSHSELRNSRGGLASIDKIN